MKKNGRINNKNSSSGTVQYPYAGENGSLDIPSELFDDIPKTGEPNKYPHTIDKTLLHKERLNRRRSEKEQEKRRKKIKCIKIEEAERFEPSFEAGLTVEQVEKRKNEGLDNFSKKKASRPVGSIFLHNFVTPINIIAAIVATALLVFGADILQLFFVLIILVNTFIGIFQEIRAKITVERLSIMTAPTVVVIRNGERKVIPVNEVVLDDIMFLEAGKQIPADSILVSGVAEANEALLTGESVPVKKEAGAELFSGSYISSGACYARVNKVGSANYIEKLTSHAKKYKKPKSELHNSINLLIKILIPIAVVLSGATILIHYFRIIRAEVVANVWAAWQDNIQAAAGLMIGMLPVGMFLLTSTALFVSVIRLGKKKALVKDFNSIEMLARADVLCLDKTGTITDGTMSVKEVVQIKNAPQFEFSLEDIIGSMLTATQDNNQTARALAARFGYSKALTASEFLPFSSKRKMAAVSFEGLGTFIYGAPEIVLKDMGCKIERLIHNYASLGHRVLVFAHSQSPIKGEKIPTSRRGICLLVIEDYIRDDAFDTIKWFKENNVAVKVISGDNPITVSEVAKRVGVKNAQHYVSLEGLSNREVEEAAEKYTVFGRVSPEQKKLLVKALKQKGHTVAMTGDGVNDILAMRESDCAIAIASGAEAARNIAHLVLQDSNFSSMPQVVMEGRRVVNNIQQTSALYIMKTIMTIILGFTFLFLRQTYPFRTNFLMLLEIVVIAIASFALALQKNDKPIKGKFISNVLGKSAPGGITLALAIIAVFLYRGVFIGEWVPLEGITGTVTMLVLMVTFVGFIVLIKICEPTNVYRTVMLLAVGAGLLVLAFAIPFVPHMGNLFSINPSTLGFADYLFLIAVIFGSYFFMSILIRIMRALKILNY